MHAPGHSHPTHAAADNERRVFWTLLLTAGFMVAEILGGIAAGSLALLADAGHMLTDAASLTLAWLAFRIGRRPQDTRRTYGYHRFQVLAAFVNGVTLIAVVGWIAIEAARRLLAPAPVAGGLMLVIAGLGLLVNIAAFAILHGGDRDNLNIRGAALHVMGDLLGSVAAIAAGAVIYATGWMQRVNWELFDPAAAAFPWYAVEELAGERGTARSARQCAHTPNEQNSSQRRRSIPN